MAIAWSTLTEQLIEAACAEDLGPGDLTAASVPDGDAEVVARVVPRRDGVICGLELGPLIARVFGARLNTRLEFAAAPATAASGSSAAPAGREAKAAKWPDGRGVHAGATVATLRGPKSAVLSTERTLLNFLGRMSGVATLTRRYVDAARAANEHVQILDTRKTIPGWRELDKYAVRCGGGTNHRSGLYDAVLIKDNHIAGIPLPRLADELAAMLQRIPRKPAFVEVEVDSLEQLAEVCKVPGVHVVLLDNFMPEQMRAAVALRNRLCAPPVPGTSIRHLNIMNEAFAAARETPRLEDWYPPMRLLEASGGITLDTIAEFAATGVDRISVGALTHSAAALDIGLDF